MFELQTLGPLHKVLSVRQPQPVTPYVLSVEPQPKSLLPEFFPIDKEFGPGGLYPWPGNLQEATQVMDYALHVASSSICIDDDLFFVDHADDGWLSQEYWDTEEEYDQEWEMLWAAESEREKLFKDAMDWPMPCLVTSAIYFTLSRDVDLYTPWEREMNVRIFWHNFFWLFLFFDEPLVDMFRRNGVGQGVQK